MNHGELKYLIKLKLKEMLREELNTEEPREGEGGDQMQQIASVLQGIQALSELDISPEVTRLADQLAREINNSLEEKSEEMRIAADDAKEAFSL